jgi:hypothetical protein
VREETRRLCPPFQLRSSPTRGQQHSRSTLPQPR